MLKLVPFGQLLTMVLMGAFVHLFERMVRKKTKKGLFLVSEVWMVLLSLVVFVWIHLTKKLVLRMILVFEERDSIAVGCFVDLW